MTQIDDDQAQAVTGGVAFGVERPKAPNLPLGDKDGDGRSNRLEKRATGQDVNLDGTVDLTRDAEDESPVATPNGDAPGAVTGWDPPQ